MVPGLGQNLAGHFPWASCGRYYFVPVRLVTAGLQSGNPTALSILSILFILHHPTLHSGVPSARRPFLCCLLYSQPRPK